MVDVFISYSRDNKPRVAEIAAAVAAAGYEVWWDAELPPHRSYGDVITEKIGMAKAAIVVWSQQSAQSEWVRAEADVARNQKKLVQTAIDDVMPPLPFNQIQFADLSEWRGDTNHPGWRKVLMSLEELCGRTPLPTSATIAEPVQVSTPVPAQAVAPAPVSPSAQPLQSEPRSASPLPWIIGAIVIVGALLGWWISQPGTTPTVANETRGLTNVVASDETGAAPAPVEAFVVAAVINDPEGFTNVRAEKSSQSAIVGKVLEGEKFLTYQQSGAWWRVRKSDGTTGFMFRKLIRLLDGPNPDPAPVASSSPGGGAMPAGIGPNDLLIADSSQRLLTADDLTGFSALELRFARNEIFARNGFRFKDPVLREHFSEFAWYNPVTDNVQLSAIEKANIALLKSAETAQ